MTVLSAQTIRKLGLITPFREAYKDSQGNSAGLSACGYDLTLDQDAWVMPNGFLLLSTAEQFKIPSDVVGIIHDKSSLARKGIAVQNTVAEPGWSGYLTLEVTNHSKEDIYIFAGQAICQVVFHFLDAITEQPYNGKYQNQERGPQPKR